jgi:hypothetical protein
LADAWADYLADAQRRGVRGIKIMGQTANLHILPPLGEIPVAKPTRKRIETWHEALSLAPRWTNRKYREGEEPEPPRELTPDRRRARRDTANRNLSDLKAALNYAAEQRKTVGLTPWREVKPFQKTTSQRVRFLTVDEQRKLVTACEPDPEQTEGHALNRRIGYHRWPWRASPLLRRPSAPGTCCSGWFVCAGWRWWGRWPGCWPASSCSPANSLCTPCCCSSPAGC